MPIHNSELFLGLYPGPIFMKITENKPFKVAKVNSRYTVISPGYKIPGYFSELSSVKNTAQFKNFTTARMHLDGHPPNPSTIDVMVGSPSKKQTRARDMLQSLGNLILVRLVIYYEFERV